MTSKPPSAFVSYSWDDDNHKAWVKDLCTRLRGDGVDVTLDQWSVEPGDQLPAFMERGIAQCDFVIIVCTPRYKDKSNSRTGGVGYEENVITGAVAATQHERKFIPVLAKGEWIDAAPTWVLGKAYVDLRGDALPPPRYEDLLITLHGIREAPPPLGPPPIARSPAPNPRAPRPPNSAPADMTSDREDDIRVVELIASEVSLPKNDGSLGSALYAVPFRLSRAPSAMWEKIFLRTWERPPKFTSMHRPGIARVRGDRIILDGTTIDEVEKAHKATLLLAVATANDVERQIADERSKQAADRRDSEAKHRTEIEAAAKRISFD